MDESQGLKKIAIFSVTEEQWDEFQAEMENASDNFDTWREWDRAVSKLCLQAQLEGVEAVRMPVDFEVFYKWCWERGKRRTAESRAEYVGQLLRNRDSSPDNN